MNTKLITRFLSETPKFWRIIQYYAASILAACVAIQELPNAPELIAKASSNLGWMAGAVAAIAQFACVKPPEAEVAD